MELNPKTDEHRLELEGVSKQEVQNFVSHLVEVGVY